MKAKGTSAHLPPWHCHPHPSREEAGKMLCELWVNRFDSVQSLFRMVGFFSLSFHGKFSVTRQPMVTEQRDWKQFQRSLIMLGTCAHWALEIGWVQGPSAGGRQIYTGFICFFLRVAFSFSVFFGWGVGCLSSLSAVLVWAQWLQEFNTSLS